MSTSTFKAVILAGGSGERFWPLSTPERPKQFLRVFGGASLIRQAVSRLDGLVSPKDVFVVTAKNLVAATRRELPEIPKCNILGEPMRRDTGAAVALGVGLAAGGADPVVGFFSSDQMVANPKAFRKVYRGFLQPGALWHLFRRNLFNFGFYYRGLRYLIGHLLDFKGSK